jgi:DNA-binding NarL/FixJ family response regulator
LDAAVSPYTPQFMRLALVEDSAALRGRMVEYLSLYPDVELVLVSDSGDAFLEAFAGMAADQRPQVVLMDIEMPGTDGIDTTALLKRQASEVEVMMLTVFEDTDRVFGAIRAGASGYLLKDTPASGVVEAARELLRGGAPLSPAIARKTLALVQQAPRPAGAESAAEASALLELTPRETEVLRGMVSDLTERELAEQLYISPHTLRSHAKNIYSKLHVHSRSGAVRIALKGGLDV